MVAMNTLNPFLNFVLPKEQTLAAFTCGQGSNSNAMKRKRVVRSVVVTETAKRSRVEVAEESRKSAKGAKSGIASSTAAALRSLKDCAYQVVDSPIGRITMVGSARGLHALLMTGKNSDEKEQEEVAQHLPHRPEDPLLSQAAVELEEYFNGLRRNFSIPLAPLGGTQFQRQVWESLRKIPYGETWSYEQQALSLGLSKSACRAVGGANGKNPLGIIIPCHRVVGKNGDLTGFSSGLDKKSYLLQLERETVELLQSPWQGSMAVAC